MQVGEWWFPWVTVARDTIWVLQSQGDSLYVKVGAWGTAAAAIIAVIAVYYARLETKRADAAERRFSAEIASRTAQSNALIIDTAYPIYLDLMRWARTGDEIQRTAKRSMIPDWVHTMRGLASEHADGWRVILSQAPFASDEVARAARTAYQATASLAGVTETVLDERDKNADLPDSTGLREIPSFGAATMMSETALSVLGKLMRLRPEGSIEPIAR